MKPVLPKVIADLVEKASVERARRRRGVTPERKRPLCGAKTYRGTACVKRAVWDMENDRPRNGRCRIHGGNSTGPKTEAGKERNRAALRRRLGYGAKE